MTPPGGSSQRRIMQRSCRYALPAFVRAGTPSCAASLSGGPGVFRGSKSEPRLRGITLPPGPRFPQLYSQPAYPCTLLVGDRTRGLNGSQPPLGGRSGFRRRHRRHYKYIYNIFAATGRCNPSCGMSLYYRGALRGGRRIMTERRGSSPDLRRPERNPIRPSINAAARFARAGVGRSEPPMRAGNTGIPVSKHVRNACRSAATSVGAGTFRPLHASCLPTGA